MSQASQEVASRKSVRVGSKTEKVLREELQSLYDSVEEVYTETAKDLSDVTAADLHSLASELKEAFSLYRKKNNELLTKLEKSAATSETEDLIEELRSLRTITRHGVTNINRQLSELDNEVISNIGSTRGSKETEEQERFNQFLEDSAKHAKSSEDNEEEGNSTALSEASSPSGIRRTFTPPPPPGFPALLQEQDSSPSQQQVSFMPLQPPALGTPTQAQVHRPFFVPPQPFRAPGAATPHTQPPQQQTQQQQQVDVTPMTQVENNLAACNLGMKSSDVQGNLDKNKVIGSCPLTSIDVVPQTVNQSVHINVPPSPIRAGNPFSPICTDAFTHVESNTSSDFIAKHLIRQSICPNSIVPFDGSPPMFHNWVNSIQSKIKGTGVSPDEILAIMVSNCTGKPKEYLNQLHAVAGGVTSATLDMIWQKFQFKFGSSKVISSHLIDAVKNFPEIKMYSLGSKLEEMSHLCHKVQFNMPFCPELGLFDTPTGLEYFRTKIPKELDGKWRRRQLQFEMREGKHPPFAVFAEHVMSLAMENDESMMVKYPSTKEVKGRAAIKTLKTEVADEPVAAAKGKPIYRSVKCVLHTGAQHLLSDCSEFKDKSAAEKSDIVKDNDLCYGCLGVFHSKRQCKSTERCGVCKGRHITVMHNEAFDRRGKEGETDKKKGEVTAKDTKAIVLKTGEAGGKSCSRTVYGDIFFQDEPTKRIRGFFIIDDQVFNLNLRFPLCH